MSAIEAVLIHYGANKVPSGRGWRKMNCPFHGDKRASSAVNHELNAFNCFACETVGNLYNVIMIQEGVEFREAKSRAEEIVGASNIPLPRNGALSRRISNKQGSFIGRRKDFSSGSGSPTSRRSRAI